MSLPQFDEEIEGFKEPMVFSNDLGPWKRVNTSCSNRRASMQKKLLLKFECGEERLAIKSGDIAACGGNQASIYC